MKERLIRAVEKLFGCKIYKTPLPRGTNKFSDIDQSFGLQNFRIVFDVGANVGQSAIPYHKHFSKAKIFSFEPVKETYKKLLDNVLNFERIQALNFGFGAEEKTVHIGLNEDSRLNSIVYHHGNREETVSIRTIDSFARENGIEIIDFLKIDTEGYEFEVLEGAYEMLRKQSIRLLHIEAEPIETEKHFPSFDKLSKFLLTFGYELFGIYEQQPHWDRRKSIRFFNPVYICKRLVEQDVTPNSYPLR